MMFNLFVSVLTTTGFCKCKLEHICFVVIGLAVAVKCVNATKGIFSGTNDRSSPR